MTFTVLTLFPEMFASLNHSIIKRAQDKGLVKINLINIRDFAHDKYKTVDDRPYGGGVGMVLKVDVIDRALEKIKNQKSKIKNERRKIVLMDPRGTTFNQQKARELSELDHLIIVCGHYEDVDARIYQLVDEVISLGDFVLTGGEIPGLAIVDSVTRLLPGVLEKEAASRDESFTENKLAPPQYTRPADYKGLKVPEELLSGNHKKISDWKQKHTQIMGKTDQSGAE